MPAGYILNAKTLWKSAIPIAIPIFLTNIITPDPFPRVPFGQGFMMSLALGPKNDAVEMRVTSKPAMMTTVTVIGLNVTKI